MRFFLLLIILFLIAPSSFVDTSSLNFQLNVVSTRSFHVLLPLTKKEHLTKCSEVFNEKEIFNESLECSNKVFSKEPYDKTLDPEDTFKNNPECFIVSKDSPDVMNASWGNYINFTLLLQTGIVGFYDDETNTIFLIENYDQRLVYLHELQHFFLQVLVGDGDAPHASPVWKECLPAYFTPSEDQLRKQNK